MRLFTYLDLPAPEGLPEEKHGKPSLPILRPKIRVVKFWRTGNWGAPQAITRAGVRHSANVSRLFGNARRNQKSKGDAKASASVFVRRNPSRVQTIENIVRDDLRVNKMFGC